MPLPGKYPDVWCSTFKGCLVVCCRTVPVKYVRLWCRILNNLVLKTDPQNEELLCLWPYLICIIQRGNCVKIHKANCSLFLVNFHKLHFYFWQAHRTLTSLWADSKLYLLYEGKQCQIELYRTHSRVLFGVCDMNVSFITMFFPGK